MKDVPEILKELTELEKLRGNIPTYVYFGAIGGVNLVKTRKYLMQASEKPEIDIVLNSSGGSASDAYRLIRTFRNKYKTVNIIIPFWAKSAATLFAFGANRLVLHEFGELGPIDVQIKKDVETDTEGEWSSALNVQASLLQIEARSREGMLEMFTKLRSDDNEEIVKIGRKQLAEMLLNYSAKFYEPLLQKVDTLELGTMARRLNEGKMYANRILRQYTNTGKEKVDSLVNFLTYDCPNHGYVVDYFVLKLYLDYVIRTNESPFSEEYDKKLNELSIRLMMADDGSGDVIGFLQDLTLKDKPGIIKKENEQLQSNKAPGGIGQIANGGGTSIGPHQNDGKGSSRGDSKSS